MKALYQNNTKKILWNVIYLLLITCLIKFVTPDFPSFYSTFSRSFLYIILTAITIFSIHNWVLLPKYFQSQVKEYTFWCVGFLLIFIIVEIFIFQNILPEYLYRNNQSLIFYFTVTILSCIGLTFLCCSYTALFLNKKGRLNFLEFFVNFSIVSFFLIVTATSGQIEVTAVTVIVFTVFYIHTFFIVPLLTKSKRKKYFSFLLLISIFYLGSIYANLNHPLNLDTSEDVAKLLFFIIGSLLLVLFLSFVYGYFRIKIVSKEKLFTLKLGAKDSELKLLKSQVNPHFLFNTLNTLYATALEENAPKTAESTAKLASLLRYMQNDISKDYIPLVNEIKYLEDYIAIQKTRCEVIPEVKTIFKNIDSQKISPGMLIPFVENAFKYGIDPSKPSVLNVLVSCVDNTINFECTNSYNDAYKTYYKEQGFGIGITNTKQRLELVYPKNYTLVISKENQLFTVKLEINIK